MYKSTYINLVYKPMSAYLFTFINLPQDEIVNIHLHWTDGSPTVPQVDSYHRLLQKSGDHNLGCTKTTNLRFA